MNNQIFIKDELTNEYYCISCSSNPKGYINCADDGGTPGDWDFPFWSNDINQAFNFKTERLAVHEMNMNDLTEDGTRKPGIISL